MGAQRRHPLTELGDGPDSSCPMTMMLSATPHPSSGKCRRRLTPSSSLRFFCESPAWSPLRLRFSVAAVVAPVDGAQGRNAARTAPKPSSEGESSPELL